MRRIAFLSISVIIIWLIFYNEIILSQTWIERAAIPTARWNPASVVLNGKIHVIEGQGETAPYGALKTVEVYDAATDSWEILAPILTARWGLVAAVVNDKIYAIGGAEAHLKAGTSQ